MAENKNSFVFYTDWADTFKALPKDKGYDLLIHMLDYVNDKDPKTDDLIINVAFQQIKNTLKRDLKGYQERKEERSYAGRLGNIKRYHPDLYKKIKSDKITLKAAEEIANSRKTSLSDNSVANVAVSDSVSVSVIYRDINISFVSIENFDEYVQNFQGDKRYLYLAYIFWDLWHRDNPNSKTTKEAKVGRWVDDMRKIIELDKTSIERMIGIYCYFTKCAKGELGFDDFWYKTIKSIGAFRSKGKTGVYYIDQIIDKVNDKRDKDQDFLRFVDGAITKFNKNKNLV